MTKKVRRKLMNKVIDALAAKPYFIRVKADWPEIPLPAGMSYPSAFVFWKPERIEWLTNEEQSGTLGLSVVGFVQSGEDLELEKADCADYIIETLNDLLSDNEFRAIATLIRPTLLDPGALNMTDLGIQAGVNPPAGSVRVDAEIVFDYDALS